MSKVKVAAIATDFVSTIIDKICSYYSISRYNLTGKSRATLLVRARKVVIYHLRYKLGLSTTEISKLMKRNHATVIHHMSKRSSDLYSGRWREDYKDIFGGKAK